LTRALDNHAGVVLVAPERGVGHLLLETPLLLAQSGKVKDAS
jgi:hypothetical protein